MATGTLKFIGTSQKLEETEGKLFLIYLNLLFSSIKTLFFRRVCQHCKQKC